MGELVGLLPLVFVGVDWGSVEHRVVVLDAAGKQMREWTSRHSGEALRELADRLAAFVEHASSCRVAIAVSYTHLDVYKRQVVVAAHDCQLLLRLRLLEL